jgi:hypothetical protein
MREKGGEVIHGAWNLFNEKGHVQTDYTRKRKVSPEEMAKDSFVIRCSKAQLREAFSVLRHD